MGMLASAPANAVCHPNLVVTHQKPETWQHFQGGNQ